MFAKSAKFTSYPRPTAAGSDKAARLSSAIQQVFQEHKARLGTKTLMSIAYSIRSN